MTEAPAITFSGERLAVRFDGYGSAAAYELFKRAKRLPEYEILLDADGIAAGISAPARFAPLLGVDHPLSRRDRLPASPFLFDDQAAIVDMALDAKRFACWSDCGGGKTLEGLEFARQVIHVTHGGRVLIVTLNEIVQQWVDEAAKFYGEALPVARLESREQMREWCQHGTIDGARAPAVAVVNYEKFNHRTEAEQVVAELKFLAGIVVDESSRLKTGGGSQKWALIKSARGIEYKLSLTATPAPNEIMEFASQASFLEKMRSDNEIIWTYFRRDEKTHRWTVKQHARKAFFEFMAAWSIYVRDPRRYGWRMNVERPPEPEMIRHTIPITPEQRQLVIEFNSDPKNVAEANLGSMFVGELNAIAATKLSQAAKGFVYVKGAKRTARPVASNKPRYVADLIAGEAAEGKGRGLQTLVWTVFDEETDILAGLLRNAPFSVEVLTGRTKPAERLAILERFRRGETRVLISRAAMLGYGMNFQCCKSMVFSGWSFSYEQFYQAVRRAYRHGQTDRVRVHLPVIPELEGQMYDAIVRKQRQHEEAIAEMEINYVAARAALTSKERAA